MTLIFLKLGGSLITDKSKSDSVKLPLINDICDEIKIALKQNPSTRLLIGHGSGSFGHFPAEKYQTRKGVKTEQDWAGFLEVWEKARQLNLIVIETMISHGLPVMSFPPSAMVTSEKGKIQEMNLNTLNSALNHSIIPVIYGDVVFDSALGATILSTEELFLYLAPLFQPKRILLAGIEPGVFKDFPMNSLIYDNLCANQMIMDQMNIREAVHPDVTGGMRKKIQIMFSLLEKMPEIEIEVFSGTPSGNIRAAINGKHLGTSLKK